MIFQKTIKAVFARLLMREEVTASTPVATTADISITCKMCRSVFVWGASEQRRFASKAWAPPRRCEQCRAWRLLPRRSRGPAPGRGPRHIVHSRSCGLSPGDLAAELEGLHTDLFLTGDPSADLIASALENQDLTQMRRVLDAAARHVSKRSQARFTVSSSVLNR